MPLNKETKPNQTKPYYLHYSERENRAIAFSQGYKHNVKGNKIRSRFEFCPQRPFYTMIITLLYYRDI